MLSEIVVSTEALANNPTSFAAVIPLVVALVTKANLNPKLKALLSAVLSVFIAVLAKGKVDSQLLNESIKNVVTALASYKAVWEHLGVNNWFPNTGLGSRNLVDVGDDPDWNTELESNVELDSKSNE